MFTANVREQTAPTVEPVSLAEAKLHLRVDADDENALIDGLVVVARRHAEMISRRSFCTRTLEAKLDCWPYDGVIELAYPPLVSVTHVKYIDTAGVERTMSAADYIVDAHREPGRIVLAYDASWPPEILRPAAAVTIRYVAGYGDPEDVPEIYRQAMLLMIGHFYENREAVVAGQGVTISQLPLAVDSLLMIDRGSF